MTVKEAYHKLKQEIHQLCQQYQRKTQPQVICVSKYQSVDKILEAYEAGIRDFGENRVQEFLEKKEKLPQDIRWHFIGSLQKNKVRKIVGNSFCIHSVDSLTLAKKISQVAVEKSVVQKLCLQLNTSHEIQKHGMSYQECLDHWKDFEALEGLDIWGLMTMAKNTEDLSLIDESFASLQRLMHKKKQTSNSLIHLSMGMSQDFALAIKRGATYIRIGRRLFSSSVN